MPNAYFFVLTDWQKSIPLQIYSVMKNIKEFFIYFFSSKVINYISIVVQFYKFASFILHKRFTLWGSAFHKNVQKLYF